MEALLAKLGIKDLFYGTLIAALGGWFWYYTVHERDIGEKKIEAVDKAAAIKQEAKVKEIQDNAQVQIDQALKGFQTAVAEPTLPAPSLVCNITSASSPVPGTAGTSKGSNGTARVPAESVGPPFNPAPGILENDRNADAQVTLLQNYIKACQDAGICSKD